MDTPPNPALLTILKILDIEIVRWVDTIVLFDAKTRKAHLLRALRVKLIRL